MDLFYRPGAALEANPNNGGAATRFDTISAVGGILQFGFRRPRPALTIFARMLTATSLFPDVHRVPYNGPGFAIV